MGHIGEPAETELNSIAGRMPVIAMQREEVPPRQLFGFISLIERDQVPMIKVWRAKMKQKRIDRQNEDA